MLGLAEMFGKRFSTGLAGANRIFRQPEIGLLRGRFLGLGLASAFVVGSGANLIPGRPFAISVAIPLLFALFSLPPICRDRDGSSVMRT